MKNLIILILAVFVSLLLFSNLNAQELDPQFSEITVKNVKVAQPQIKEKKKKKDKDKKTNEAVNIEAVSVKQNKSKSFNVISYDENNEIVKDLNADNYKVFVNDNERKINTFKSFKDGMNIVLMFDNSNSASLSGDIVKSAFIDFIDKVRPPDKLYLVSYDENVKLLATPDLDKQKVRQKIEKIEPGNGTSVYDAIDVVFSKVAIDKNLPTAVISITDGVDTTSTKNNFQQILQKTENYNAVFSIIYQDTFAEFTTVPKIVLPSGVTLGKRPTANGMGTAKEEYALGVSFLNSLTSSTGGRVMSTNSTIEGYKKAFEIIYEEFQNMNSLGFESDNENSDDIKIKVNRPNLKITTNNRLVFEDK